MTVLNGEYLDVSWTAPSDGNNPIDRYYIMIQSPDGVTYNEETTGCDGSQTAVVAAAACSIPKWNLSYEPHSIPWGTNVYVKIVAAN